MAAAAAAAAAAATEIYTLVLDLRPKLTIEQLDFTDPKLRSTYRHNLGNRLRWRFQIRFSQNQD